MNVMNLNCLLCLCVYEAFVFSRDLFNAAFVSCWSELSETQQDELINSLEQALTSQDIPEITQALLNLAEFMEHCDKVRYCKTSLETTTYIYCFPGQLS